MSRALNTYSCPEDKALYDTMFYMWNVVIKMDILGHSKIKIKIGWKKYKELRRAALSSMIYE